MTSNQPLHLTAPGAALAVPSLAVISSRARAAGERRDVKRTEANMNMMTGPEVFQITYDLNDYSVVGARIGRRFGGSALARGYKLYVVSQDDWPVYVGVTTRPLVDRFRLGWNAKGESGYYGYEWRKSGSKAEVALWTLPRNAHPDPKRFLETLEAEVVFHIRCAGQWPKWQTEIHFHASTETERMLAREILARYTLPNNVLGPTARN